MFRGKKKYLILFQKKRMQHQHIVIKKHSNLQLSWWQIHIQTTVVCVLLYQYK